MQSDQLEQWLLSLPLDEPCEVAGEQVYLAVSDRGAEIGLVLLPKPTQAQVVDAMRTGFQGALSYGAGVALAPGGELLLNRFLVGAEAWSDAAEALEDLLNQASLWRAAMAPQNGRSAGSDRDGMPDEARARRALGGA